MNTNKTPRPRKPRSDLALKAMALNEEDLMAAALEAFRCAVDAQVVAGATFAEREAASLEVARRVARRAAEMDVE